METPYAEMEPPSKTKQCCKCFGKAAGGVCGVFVLLAILVQAFLYWWATLHCSASKLQDYPYPGGGDKNLVPANSLLVEQAPRWWGSSFINIPSDDVGLANGASTGVYFRTWGPLWYTYTYQDVLGQETFVIRDRPLAIGGSHKIMRCDGKGPSWVVSEGGHWLMNGIRSLLGMYTSRIYNIWEGNELVAISEKLGGKGQSHKQIIFRAPSKAAPFASSFLKERHFHGEYDEWFVQTDKNSSLPNFIPNAVTMMMAFVTAGEKAKVPAKPAEFLEVSSQVVQEAPEEKKEVPTNPAEFSEVSGQVAQGAPEEMTDLLAAPRVVAEADDAVGKAGQLTQATPEEAKAVSVMPEVVVEAANAVDKETPAPQQEPEKLQEQHV